MSQILNQFSQNVEQGELSLALNTNTIAAQVYESESAPLVAGQAVKIVDTAGETPIVTAVTADTDDVFGFVNYNQKDQSYGAGERLEISYFRGNVMWMTASAAIARNAQVMVVVSGNKIATATSAKRIIGRLLDKATGDNDLVRVVIDLPGGLA